jgi:hypothetical protein
LSKQFQSRSGKELKKISERIYNFRPIETEKCLKIDIRDESAHFNTQDYAFSNGIENI